MPDQVRHDDIEAKGNFSKLSTTEDTGDETISGIQIHYTPIWQWLANTKPE
jgi:hypothetical protein